MNEEMKHKARTSEYNHSLNHAVDVESLYICVYLQQQQISFDQQRKRR